MFKRTGIINRAMLVTGLFLCALLLGGLFLFFFHRGREGGKENSSFTDMVNQNYKELKGNTESNVISISEEGVTLKIYDVFLESNEVVLKYELLNNNVAVPVQSVNSLVMSDDNQRVDYKAEYNAKGLAVFRNEKSDIVPDFRDKNVKIDITFLYMLSAKKGSEGFSRNFEFHYTPEKIYDESVIEVNSGFSYLNKQIKINRLVFNGLYMIMECSYDFKTISDVWYTFQVKDEFNKKITCYASSIEDGGAKYFLAMKNKDKNVLYISPSAHQYEASKKNKEKITPIKEKIKITIP